MTETIESNSMLFSQDMEDKQVDFRETSLALVEENNSNKDDSDDEIFAKSKTKRIIDSDSDSDNSTQNGAREKFINVSEANEDSGLSDSSSKKSDKNVSTQSKKKIIRQLDSDSDESGSNNKNNHSGSNDYDSDKIEENIVHSTRIKDKRKKFTEKFQNLFCKSKNPLENGMESNDSVIAAEASKSKISNLYDSESSDDDRKSTVSDNENSNESDEEKQEQVAIVQKSFGQKPKGTKMIAAKHEKPAQRMSAKQAMEQMHKIKSESGRMLREKDVSLPYHRPKQVSLKDILAKKKNNGMGIKMNSDQLKEYAQQLKQREIEMLEMCKSESDSEEDQPEDDIQKEVTSDINQPNIEELSAHVTSEENPIKLIDACKNLMTMFQDEEKRSTNKDSVSEDVENIVPSLYDALSNGEPETCPQNSENISDIKIMDQNEDSDAGAVTECVDKTSPKKSIIAIDTSSPGVTEQSNVISSVNYDEILAVEAAGDEKMETELNTEVDYVNSRLNDDENSTEMFDSEVLFPDKKIEDHFGKAHSKTQPDAQFVPVLSSQSFSCSVPNAKPRLTGSPGCFIDLMSGEVQSGVEMLKKKFLFHAAIKTPEEREREKERRIKPGSSLVKLKRDLEDKMTDQRTLEWTKRLEEDALKKKETNDNLSDSEDMLEEFEVCKNIDDVDKDKKGDQKDSDSDAESEPEENDVLITDEKKDKCGFADEEAEVEDDEDASSGDENDEDEDSSSEDSGDDLDQAPLEGKKTLTRIIKPIDSDSSDDENQTENGKKELDSLQNGKLDCSEESINIVVLSTPLKNDRILKPTQSEDLFESQETSKNDTNFSLDWEEELPLGQKLLPPNMTPLSMKMSSASSFSEPGVDSRGRSDLSSLVSPIIKLTAVQRMPTTSIDQTPSPCRHPASPKYKSPLEADKFTNLQKKLLFESEGSELLQDTQELENLCSGNFPTQGLKSSCKPSDVTMTAGFHKNTPTGSQMTQNTENELLELCTGKFAGINDSGEAAIELNTSNGDKAESQNISLIWSETQNTEEIAIALSKITSRLDGSEKNTLLITGSTEIVQEVTTTNNSIVSLSNTDEIKAVNKSITSFFKTSNKEVVVMQELETVHMAEQGKKFHILTSSDEEMVGDEEKSLKKKVLKSRKEREKKRKQLKISDDEESEDEDRNSVKSFDDGAGEDKLIDYDSEENEIVLQPDVPLPKKQKGKQKSEFFDQEAELTSEDEWKASGDEDERGLDQMEREEGDDDQFDQRAMKKQLDRIHLRQILDDDKREVAMLQEMLLEDDMEGGTRERKFRWKNVDNNVEAGAAVGDDDLDGGGLEDLQSEEQWRKQRHERQTFLRQMMEKESTEGTNNSQGGEPILKKNRPSFIKSALVKIKSQSSQYTLEITGADLPVKETEPSNGNAANRDSAIETNDIMEKTRKKPVNDVSEPVKKTFLIQNNARGSFLSRGQAAMNRLNMLTRNAPPAQESDEPSNLNSLAPGKKRNFVFATVSPPCNKEMMNEDSKMAKRKATSEMSTPVLIKKIKMVENNSKIRSRKSLMDHLQ